MSLLSRLYSRYCSLHFRDEDTEAHVGRESTRAKIQVNISDIQNPPPSIMPHPPSAWTSPGTWPSWDTGELRGMVSPLGAHLGLHGMGGRDKSVCMSRKPVWAAYLWVQDPCVFRVHACVQGLCVQEMACPASYGLSQVYQVSSFYSYPGTCRAPHLRIEGRGGGKR